MRHIDNKEFLEMERNYLERKKQMEENIKENKQSLKQEWAERQKFIPSYDNPFAIPCTTCPSTSSRR